MLASLLAGCSSDAAPTELPPRPVTFVTLGVTNPAVSERLTGSVESWKREEIAFEVPGRVVRVVDPGTEIQGHTYDERGELIAKGTVVAELDTERYEVALDQAEAQVAAAQAQVTAVQAEIEEVIPQQLQRAHTNLDLQTKQVARYRDAIQTASVSEAELDIVEAAYSTAGADVAAIEGTLQAKRAELDSLRANVRNAEEAVRQARINLEDCNLSAPFSGQIARVHVIPGGIVGAGQPVFTVQMMDPIKVDVAVSAAVDARVDFNDLLRVYLPGETEHQRGLVYLKDTYADPATRTYLITLLVRNRVVEVGIPEGLAREKIPTGRNLWTLERPQQEQQHYIDVEALQEDAQGHYVWQAADLSIDDLYGTFDPVLTVRKVRVTAGDRRRSYVIYTYRELTDLGGLDPATDIVVSGIEGEPQDGGELLLVRERWLLRPGDLAEVDLGLAPEPGFFVPEGTVQYDGREHFVWLARPMGSDLHEVVRARVTPGQMVGSLQRIEPLGEGELTAGAKVVVDGAHYVISGEEVNLIEEVSVDR